MEKSRRETGTLVQSGLETLLSLKLGFDELEIKANVQT